MMKRRSLKLVALAFAAIVLVTVSAFVLLQTSLVSRFIFNRVRGYLHSNSGINLSASRINLNLLKKTVLLQDVSIRSASAPDLPPIFKSPRIYARLGILNTIRGIIDIEDLRISAPEVCYFARQDGKTNFPARASSSGPTPKLLVAHAEIKDGSFRFRDLQSRADFSLPSWQLSVEGNRLTLNHQISLTARQAASFTYQGRTIPVDYLQFLGMLGREGIDILSAKAGSSKSQISVRGSMSDFSSPEISLQLAPNLDLKGISEFLQLEPMRGNLSGTIALTGKLQNLNITAQLKGFNINAGYYTETNFELGTRAEWSTGRVLLRSFALNSPEGSLNGTAEFSTRTEAGTSSVKAYLRDFDLYPIWKQIKPPFDLASRGSGNISLRWKGPLNVSTLEAGAHMNLTSVRSVPGRNLLPISGTLDATMQSGRMLGNLRTFSVMGVQIDGSFSLLSFKTIDANVHGGIANLDAPLTQVSQFLGDPDRSLDGIGIAGPAQFNAHVQGSLGDPQIVVSAGCSRSAGRRIEKLARKDGCNNSGLAACIPEHHRHNTGFNNLGARNTWIRRPANHTSSRCRFRSNACVGPYVNAGRQHPVGR